MSMENNQCKFVEKESGPSRSSWFQMLTSQHLRDPPDKLSKCFLIPISLGLLWVF